MHILSAVTLGALQGITEFLPISSSGHLIIVRDLFGVAFADDLAFDVFLHLATALAVLFYFRADFFRAVKSVWNADGLASDRTLLMALVLGTIPAALVGFFFEGEIGGIFRTSATVAYALIAGSVLFLVAEWAGKRFSSLSPGKGFIIGCFQALALIPGVSRSGASISGGLLMNLSREEATRFAFLLSFPIILGAGVREAFAAPLFAEALTAPFVLGALAAFATALLSIGFLMRYLRNHSLTVFIVYRLILAAVILFFL